MKYIYGPVKSRRLGLSLGLSITPYKVCDFDCTYCQLGKTPEKVIERKEYISPDQIIQELKSWIENNKEEEKKINYITISGAGEPTLNIRIAEIISGIKAISRCQVAVITNASLLHDKEVRQALLEADLLLPSLDAAGAKVFSAVDRPHQDIRIENIINGLIDLRKEFHGKIWLEVMLVRGVNDDLRHIKKLKNILEEINPDKIQLNSPVRTTAEPNILAVNRTKLKKIQEILGEKAEII